jgi:hypothetical protein
VYPRNTQQRALGGGAGEGPRERDRVERGLAHR